MEHVLSEFASTFVHRAGVLSNRHKRDGPERQKRLGPYQRYKQVSSSLGALERSALLSSIHRLLLCCVDCIRLRLTSHVKRFFIHPRPPQSLLGGAMTTAHPQMFVKTPFLLHDCEQGISMHHSGIVDPTPFLLKKSKPLPVPPPALVRRHPFYVLSINPVSESKQN